MSMFVQFVGAGLVLLAFVLAQLGRLQPTSYPILWLNTAGAGILAVLAFLDSQWGFFALEGIWASVAAAGLVTRVAHVGTSTRPHASLVTTKEQS